MIYNPIRLDDDNDRVEAALRGQYLYGDDFTGAELEEWFRDEAEAYFDLVSGDDMVSAKGLEQYEYEELVAEHAFRWLPDRQYPDVLGLGCAMGMELFPILHRSSRVTILEPSDGFAATEIQGKPVEYVKPDPSGVMPFEDESFDLIICFGVLHHIPNVSAVLREIYRVLKPGGRVLLREPTISLGDWRTKRRGLTKRERGIPFDIFRDMIKDSNFGIEYQSRCMFSLTYKLRTIIRRPPFRTKWVVLFDRFLCRLPIWSKRYHATSIWHRFRPTSAAFVLSK